MSKQSAHESTAWWRFGHVWLVIAGPAIVVVAAFITLYLAITSPNEIVSDDVGQPSRVTGKGSASATSDASTAPAMLARNHAQTGVVPVPK